MFIIAAEYITLHSGYIELYMILTTSPDINTFGNSHQLHDIFLQMKNFLF